MPVVSFKCPNCGASLDFQKEKQVSICKSCGAGSYIEKNGDNYSTYLVDVNVTNNNYIENATVISGASENIDNLIELMEQAHRAKNFEDCYMYASRVLEYNPKHSLSWFYKGLSSGYTSSLARFNSKEILSCYINALKYSQGKEKENIKWKSGQLINLAKHFIDLSREHAIEFGGVETVNQDHINDIRQSCSMLLELYKMSANKEALKTIVIMAAGYNELKEIKNETMKVLEGLDPVFVQQQKDDNSFEKVATCGCGLLLILIVGIPLFLFLRTVKW
jgi:hypothetical protein